MDYEKELSKLKDDLNKATNLKYKAEAQLEQLKKQEEEIINELNKLGIKPEDLEREIDRLKKEIETMFREANELLPKDLLQNR
jgi:chromosome segregation ATPase